MEGWFDLSKLQSSILQSNHRTFFMSDDYIKFVSNLKHYIECDLKFVELENSRHYDELKKDKNLIRFPIGLLDDIEIMFLHYSSEEEAYRKWTRRVKRINWDNMIIKFNDQNGCKDEHIRIFDKLDYNKKICFTAKKHQDLSSVVFINKAKKQRYIFASQEPFGNSRYLNLNVFLGNG